MQSPISPSMRNKAELPSEPAAIQLTSRSRAKHKPERHCAVRAEHYMLIYLVAAAGLDADTASGAGLAPGQESAGLSGAG